VTLRGNVRSWVEREEAEHKQLGRLRASPKSKTVSRWSRFALMFDSLDAFHGMRNRHVLRWPVMAGIRCTGPSGSAPRTLKAER
jgi:hypothetical protein